MLSQTLSRESEFKENSNSNALKRITCSSRPGRILCWAAGSCAGPRPETAPPVLGHVLGGSRAGPRPRRAVVPRANGAVGGSAGVLGFMARDLTAPGGASPERCGPGRALPLDPIYARRISPGVYAGAPQRPAPPGPIPDPKRVRARSARPGPKRSARPGPKRSARSGPARFAGPPDPKGREAKRGPGARPSRTQ